MPRHGYTLLELIIVVAILALLIGLLLPSVQFAREAARRTQCGLTVRQLVLAHHVYHDAHAKFPVEWARRLIPNGASFDELSSLGSTPAGFQCPSNVHDRDAGGFGLTPYGQNMFLVDEPISAITDGTSCTVLHGESVEVDGSRWSQSPLLKSVNCESGHTHGAHYGMADGTVKFLADDLAEDLRMYLIRPNDHQVTVLP